MENKKLGIVLVVLSVLIGGMFLYNNSVLSDRSDELNCFPTDECGKIESSLSIGYFAVGVFSFLLALGFYLIFFNKTERIILEKLEDDKNRKVEDMKFDILYKALDPFEGKVIKAVREQPGITQNTLRIRLDMSKAKLSYVLQELEKRGLVKRVEKGKTLAIHLRI